VESPSYDRAILTFSHHEAQVVGIPLEADGVNVAVLEQALSRHRPKLFYIIGDFQNPAGVTTSAAKRRTILALARQHGFTVVEDVPYRPLRYYGKDEPTFLSLAPEHVLQLSSFSKLLSPGMRTGYLLGSPATVAKVAKIAEDTYITPVLPTQGAVYEYCRQGLLDRNIARLRELYRPKLEATLAALATDLPEGVYARPEGGYFVGVYLPAGLDSRALLARAGEAGLVLTDGDGFFPATAAPDRPFVRIPFCSASVAELNEGIARLAQVTREGR
jgi:2-aminoadipate transaminase